MSKVAKADAFVRMKQREGYRSEMRVAVAVAIQEWKVDLSYPLSLLYFIVSPFLWFLPFILVGSAAAGSSQSSVFSTTTGTTDWVSYVAIGNAFSALCFSIFWGSGLTFRREQNTGTLETLLTTPMKKETLVWGAMLHSMLQGGFGVIVQLLFSVLFFGVTINAWGILPSLAILGLALIGMQGVVFAIICIVLVAKQGWMIVDFIGSTLMLIAPISYPIAVLHPVLQYAAVSSPLTWSVESFRSFLMNGLLAPGILEAVIALVVLDIIFLLVGLVLFRATDRYVRKRGALSQF
jgi:ABC-2 type transport system permease protein